MTNKIYENIKKFIKENKRFIINYTAFLLVIAFSFFIKLDYEIYCPGGLKNLNTRIEVEDAYESDGSFNLTYVSARPGTIPNILLSFIIPSWDLISIDESRIENEDYEEIVERGKIDLNNVSENAVKVAFETANQNYEITKNDITVYYVYESAKTNLKVGDIIKEIDGIKIEKLEDLKEILNTKNENDKINIKISRNGKTKEAHATLYESEGNKLIGIYLTSVIKVRSEKDVSYKFKSNELGASSGLMSTLEIYNRITKEDITKGLKIAGTGTINLDGSVGEIGGVKYKLKGAVKKGADIFIVPTNNYDETLKEKNKHNYKIKLIEADTFNNVLEKLKEI